MLTKHEMTLKSDRVHAKALDEMLFQAEELGMEDDGYTFEYHLIRERDMWFTLAWTGHEIEARFKD